MAMFATPEDDVDDVDDVGIDGILIVDCFR